MGRHEYIQADANGSEWTSLNLTVLDKTVSCADDFRELVCTT